MVLLESKHVTVLPLQGPAYQYPVCCLSAPTFLLLCNPNKLDFHQICQVNPMVWKSSSLRELGDSSHDA